MTAFDFGSGASRSNESVRRADRNAFADDPGRASRSHGYAVEAVGGFHGSLLVADHQQLGFGSELVHEVEEAVQVDVVEGGLHFVHEVERRRPAPEHREEEGHGGQAPFAARKQRQPADVFSRRAGLHLDPGIEKVVGVGEAEATHPAREESGEKTLEVVGHVGVGGPEHLNDFGVDGSDDFRQFPPGVAHVLELLVQKAMALQKGGVLLQGQRIDGAHEAQLALELRPPARGAGPGRERRAFSAPHRFGFAVEIPPDRFDDSLQPDPAFGLVELGAIDTLAHFAKLSFGGAALAAQLFEAFSPGLARLGLGPSGGTQPVEDFIELAVALDSQSHQAVGHRHCQLQLVPPGGRFIALCHVTPEPPLHLVEAAARDRAPLVEGGSPDFDISAQGG